MIFLHIQAVLFQIILAVEIRTSDQLILLAYVVQPRFGGQFETGYNKVCEPVN